MGSRFWLTRSSMIWGRLFSNMALHSASRVGEPMMLPRLWQISLKNATIWSSVVASVMKLSRSVMTSTQMVQVRSLVLVLRGGVCDEVVKVGDDVDADGAGEIVGPGPPW